MVFRVPFDNPDRTEPASVNKILPR
jgi:hypothetical protein